ncbi:MAG: efflux RND transporter permease subunit [Thermoanaerobaculia bacterium]|nr:efflux RND transporter permease subunit [Thermoanaerobaculia bacterium]
MNLTRAAIEKDRVTVVLLLVLLATGVQSFLTLPQSEDPGFVVRTAVVQTFFPGGSPERVEQLVTDPIEEAIQEIPELDAVRSTSKTGVSLIFVDIREEYADMRPIWDSLRRKVERVRGELPDGVMGPIVDDEFGDVFGIVLTLTGDGFTDREVEDVALEVRDELLLLPDVAKVDLFGTQEERIFVEFNNARLAEVGLSALQLQGMLEARNILISGGSVSTRFERIVLEPSGNFESIEDLRRTVIQVPSTGQLLFLEDLASVWRGTIDPPQALARGTGGSCVVLAVSMREGGNIVELGTQVEPLLERLRVFYPVGIDFDVVQFAPRTVADLVDGFVDNLFQAIAIVTLVMLVSLGPRTGLVVATLIPMAMLGTLLMMTVFDIGLDQMSIASLIIALGMLVDNAIVMSEAILVRMEQGEEPVAAAVGAANELRIPLLTSSLTTAAAFLPIYLAESAVGEYTAPLFKVVTLTLLCSWLLSLTMIPLLCARALRVKKRGDRPSMMARLAGSYRTALAFCLRRRGLFLGAVVAVFVVAMLGFSRVPNLFFPPNDRTTFTADLKLPVGSPIERTTEVVEEVENYLHENLVVGRWNGETDDGEPDGVTNWATFIGNGGPKFTLGYNPGLNAPETAVILANTVSRPVIDEITPQMERWINERFPDVRATVRPLENGPPAWPPVQVRLSGRDTEELFDLVETVKAKMAEIEGTKLIDDDWGPRAKKLRVQIDEPRALRAGVSHQDVAISLQAFLDGLQTTEYREGDRIIPVTLRSAAAGRRDLLKLEALNVSSQATGQAIPLRQVADVEIAWEAAQIKRRNRLRSVAVECGVLPGTTASDVVAELEPWLEEQAATWPPGTSYELGGELESSGEANASIGEKLPIAGMIILLLLVTQFNSIRRPAIILITIPLGLIGVVAGLLLARSYFGFMTLLGIISLAGIVINNAIVLLDRIRIEIDEVGRPPYEAVLEATQQRLRPILLTTCTTIGGMIPLWLGGGAMWEPMAISIIFGLAFATALTLGVVPVLYAVFFRVQKPA